MRILFLANTKSTHTADSKAFRSFLINNNIKYKTFSFVERTFVEIPPNRDTPAYILPLDNRNRAFSFDDGVNAQDIIKTYLNTYTNRCYMAFIKDGDYYL